MPTRILLLEDNPDDVLLTQLRVKQEGLAAEWVVVDTLPAFREAIRAEALDLVLLDHHLEGFEGTEALKILRAQGLDIPALLLTGTLGEEAAADVMRAGATDIILKDHLARLVPALKRELQATRTRRAKHAQEQENRLLQRAIGQCPDAILITDPTGLILYANPALLNISGYTHEEVVGHNPRLFKSGRHDAAYYESMWTTLLKGEAWRGVFFNRRKDGSLWEQESCMSPVFDETGSLAHYIATSRDITHEHELEQRMAQSQRLETIGVLTSGVAHDFNNILMPVLAHAELGLQRDPGDPKLHRDLEVIQTSAQRAADLVKQILAFSRKTEVAPTAVEVQALLRESLLLLRASLPSTVAIEEQLEAATYRVLADPTQLNQVILNLCTNAGQAMRGTMGKLRVSLKQEVLPETDCAMHVRLGAGSYLVLEVADTGRGILPEHLPQIFLPFFTTKAPGEGTGLGLSITSGIITGLGGGIQVESTPGVGTSFRVFLPVAQHPAARTQTAPTTPIHGQERILLVDDEPAILEALGAGLRHLGYGVLPFASPRQALEVFRAAPFLADLLITDFTMPQLTGLDLTREVLKLRPDFKVILMTGYADQADEAKAKQGGCAAFLQKPLGAQALTETIRGIMKG